jgi:hypothetical protein
MRKTSIGNPYVSESGKKSKNKKNAKSSSTDVDSNSQKHDSSSNQKKISHLNLSIKTQKSHKMIRQNTPQKKKHLYLPINELKQFKTWNCSNLNAIYQNILANEKVNYLYIKPIFGNHFDINDIHRTILVDWLINVHLYFKLSDECLYLSIKLIDSFLARTTNFTKNKLQLLGICSLQISSKYIEQVHPSINDLSDLCDKCYEKKDIVEFEKHLLQVNDYIIEQDQILNYYDLLCLILRFNIKYYFFGKMLLDLTLLDIDFYKYQKNTIVFSICYLILINYKMIINMTDSLDTFINTSGEKSYKLYSFRFPDTPYVNNEVNMDINPINIINYLFSFYPYKDKKPVFECCKDIINLFEKMRTSKYNSAIQKYFIQIKEIKEDVTIESTNENYENSNSPSLFSNFIENQNQVSEDKLDDDNEMIIVD